MDYLQRTMMAYEAGVERYEEATREICATEEAERLLTLLPISGTVLDAGCAYGRDVSMLHSLGAHVVGVDASRSFIQRARELYPELQFEQMDVRKLEFPDESFAGLWCHATLLHFKNHDLSTVLAEYRRVLVPQGILFVTFKEGEGHEEIVEKFSSDAVRYFNYQKLETVEVILEKGGFDIVDNYRVNEKERWGKRDLNWVYCFARKRDSAF